MHQGVPTDHWEADLAIQEVLCHVFWTGGFDSTFRLAQLLAGGVDVQPIYVSQRLDIRKNRAQEVAAMATLTDRLRARFSGQATLRDTLHVTQVSRNARIREQAARIGYGPSHRERMGAQYVVLCEFAAAYHAPVEIGIEIGGRAERMLRGLTRGDGARRRIAPEKLLKAGDKPLLMFADLRFPLLTMTKQDMLLEAHSGGYRTVLRETWSCWFPRGGKPCGKCSMCKQRPPLDAAPSD
jgi:7-cyano-7-deazaguanine synthase